MVIFIDTENQWRMEGGTRKGRKVSFEPRHFHALFYGEVRYGNFRIEKGVVTATGGDQAT